MHIKKLRTRVCYRHYWWGDWRRLSKIRTSGDKLMFIRHKLWLAYKGANFRGLYFGPFDITIPWFVNKVFKAYQKSQGNTLDA